MYYSFNVSDIQLWNNAGLILQINRLVCFIIAENS